MRKQTKLAVGLSAAALLAIGASMTSLAVGWVQEGDEWYYVDNSGDYVENKWKSYNGSYFYLGDDGAMLTNELVEDGDNYYYVDANGAMVKNTWVAIAADEEEEQDVDYRWYYFGSSGKAYKGTGDKVSAKTINGKKYAFDEEGKMLFGFVNESGEILNENDDNDPILECTYYFGTNDDGAMFTGWLRYEDGFSDDDYDEYDYDYYWFNFKSSGVKRTAEGSGVKSIKISGKYYAFDDKGVMLTDWSQTASAGAANTYATAYKFYSSDLADGSMAKNTWVYAVAGEDMRIYENDDSEHWYRTTNTGTLVYDQTKKINSKWYVFSEDGVMQYGLVTLDSPTISGAKIFEGSELHKSASDATGTYGKIDQDSKSADDIINKLQSGEYLYYFSSDEETDGSAKSGTITISLADDDYTFAFQKTSFRAYEGVESKKAYLAGMRQDAGSQKYVVAQAGHSALTDCVDVLVNSSGTVQTSTSKYYKDDDDCYYVLGASDKITLELYGDTEATETSYDIFKFDDKDNAQKFLKLDVSARDDNAAKELKGSQVGSSKGTEGTKAK